MNLEINKRGVNKMSYMRIGYPMKWFVTDSSYYVFLHSEGHMEDYNEDYGDPCSLIELIGNFILRETGDEKYATKMVRILAQRMKVYRFLKKEYK